MFEKTDDRVAAADKSGEIRTGELERSLAVQDISPRPESKARSRKRPFFFKAVSLILGFLVVLGAIELVLRLSLPGPPWIARGSDLLYFYFDPDSELEFSRQANVDLYFYFPERPSGSIHFRTNNHGLRRTRDTSYEKGSFKRLLILGDSHVDGAVDNSETLSTLLEELLDQSGRSWEILNAAIGGTSPYQSLLWYSRQGVRYHPDIVILTFYLGNDLAELGTPDRHRLEKTEVGFKERKPDSGPSWKEITPWIRMHTVLLRNWQTYGVLQLLNRSGPQVGEDALSRAYQDCLGCTAQSLAQIFLLQDLNSYSKHLEILREVVRRFQSVVKSSGAKPILMLLPTRLQIEPELDESRISEMLTRLGLSRTEAYVFEDHLAEEVGQISREENILLLDLTPELERARNQVQGGLYYESDWHLNARGHRLVAEILFTELF